MKILLTGKGGREHALAHALHRSPSNPTIYAYPGNDGMASFVQDIQVPDIDTLIDWMTEQQIDLCVAGEESYLAVGLADKCTQAGIRVWGPVQRSAQLESSKIFAKEFMNRHQIPTASYTVAASSEEVRAAITEYPCVLKYDGLAAGKGVSVCTDQEQVDAFIESVFENNQFGQGLVIVEQCLEGQELSIICAVTNGTYQWFTPARDYKRQLDGDQGPNTGGMGAVSSQALMPPEQLSEIEQHIIKPVVEGFIKEKMLYRGFLYFGLMLTKQGARVLEFNCRFGDPEAQAILPLVDGDLATYLYEAANGDLRPDLIHMNDAWSLCLVLASKDYPYRSDYGQVITGLDMIKHAYIYHAGTEKNNHEQYIVNGGRVLSLVCRGESLEQTRITAYTEIEKVTFKGAQYRKDIGRLHFEKG
ncbi:MAG: phosphoribosylamine--glycine ligase [Kiritimatiellae bacterium]|nr:phosphoribosylamine--glycine ligase [Kiritimatiellia bacterium]